MKKSIYKSSKYKNKRNNFKYIISAIIIVSFSIMPLSACKKGASEATGSPSPEVSAAITSPEITASAQIDGTQGKSEFISSQPLTLDDLSHNIYEGTIGDEKVIMDIFPNKATGTYSISFISDSHSEDITYTFKQLDNKLIYKDDSLFLTLYQTGEGVLAGSYTDKTSKSKDISLTLSHISGSHDLDHRYAIGTNEEVEAFAADVLKVIANDDLAGLSKMIQYPLSMKNTTNAKVLSEKDLVAKGTQTVITSKLKEAMAGTFPRFMFSNYEGVMLGSGDYNIWFSDTENGIKIIAINN